jgi:hypothetical protein
MNRAAIAALKSGGIAVGLALCCTAASQGQGTITGTVLGQSVSGTTVIACLRVNDECDAQQSKAVQVGARGVYALEGLGSGPYLIFAMRDLNNSGELDAGDEAAVYSRDGKTPTPLRPPQRNIDLRLRAYDGTDASLLSAPSNQGSVPRQAQDRRAMVGEWSAKNGAAAVVTYTIKADGTYNHVGRFQQALQSGCTRAGVYTPPYNMLYITGSYRVTGNQITFTPRSGTYISDTSCNRIERPTSPENLKARTFTWRIGEHAGSVALFLMDANGEQVFYR